MVAKYSGLTQATGVLWSAAPAFTPIAQLPPISGT